MACIQPVNARQAVKEALLEAECPYPIRKGSDNKFPSFSVYRRLELAWRWTSKKRQPGDDDLLVLVGWLGHYDVRDTKINGFAADVISYSTGSVECFVGDQRVLILVEESLLRRDRPYRAEYPPDWRWYGAPGRKHYWKEGKNEFRHGLQEESLELIREMAKEAQVVSVARSHKDARRRVPRKEKPAAADTDSDTDDEERVNALLGEDEDSDE